MFLIIISNYNNMDYYKYIKYKTKYIQLRNMIGGNYCDFTDEKSFEKIGTGIESKIYIHKEEPDIAYKVMIIIKPPQLGAWNKPIVSKDVKKLIQLGAGVSIQDFQKKCENYRKASELGLGPTFIKCYICDDKYAIIKMQRINGITINKLKESGKYDKKYDAEFNRIKTALYHNKIISSNIIDDDAHDDNFMIETSTGKIYGIDF